MKLFKENYVTDSRIDFSKGIKQFQGNTIENPTGLHWGQVVILRRLKAV